MGAFFGSAASCQQNDAMQYQTSPSIKNAALDGSSRGVFGRLSANRFSESAYAFFFVNFSTAYAAGEIVFLRSSGQLSISSSASKIATQAVR